MKTLYGSDLMFQDNVKKQGQILHMRITYAKNKMSTLQPILAHAYLEQ